MSVTRKNNKKNRAARTRKGITLTKRKKTQRRVSPGVAYTRKHYVFKKKDYASGDGMLTSVWGPSMWHYMHTMSFNYPLSPTPQEKRHYMQFVKSLQHTLPCKYCRMNLVTNFKTLPITMDAMKNRDTFSRYIYQLHELINTMLGKKSNLTYCDVRERYEHFRARCTEEKPAIYKIVSKQNRKGQKEKKGKGESGCTEPLYGKKSKCIIKIVPQTEKINTFQMDRKCLKSR